jgi:hypothetical protein
MKICGRCKQQKELTDFYKRKRYKDGLSYICKEWASGEEASQKLNLSHGSICSVLNGKRNHCGGFKWKYKLINKRRK